MHPLRIGHEPQLQHKCLEIRKRDAASFEPPPRKEDLAQLRVVQLEQLESVRVGPKGHAEARGHVARDKRLEAVERPLHARHHLNRMAARVFATSEDLMREAIRGSSVAISGHQWSSSVVISGHHQWSSSVVIISGHHQRSSSVVIISANRGAHEGLEELGERHEPAVQVATLRILELARHEQLLLGLGNRREAHLFTEEEPLV